MGDYFGVCLPGQTRSKTRLIIMDALLVLLIGGIVATVLIGLVITFGER